jgi:hypothetical protein
VSSLRIVSISTWRSPSARSDSCTASARSSSELGGADAVAEPDRQGGHRAGHDEPGGRRDDRPVGEPGRDARGERDDRGHQRGVADPLAGRDETGDAGAAGAHRVGEGCVHHESQPWAANAASSAAGSIARS